MANEHEQQDYIWLVKSNSSVLGPYKFDEVVESIFKGDIHVLDEIKGPFERWRPIRDHSLFNAAIEKLKATTYARREYTVTDTLDVNTAEFTQTLTNTNVDEHTQTITSDITASGLDGGTPTPPVAGRGARNNRHNVRYPLPNEQVQEPPKVYPQPLPKPKPQSHFPIAFFLTLVMIIGGAVVFTMVGVKESTSTQRAGGSSLFNKFFEDGLQALKVGEEEEAYQHFRKAYFANRDSIELKLFLAPLLIQLRKGPLESKVTGLKLAVDVLAQNRPNDIAAARSIIALAHSYGGQSEEAIKELKRAVEVNDKDYPVLVNLGYELIKAGRPEEAATHLRAAKELDKYKWEGMARFLLMRALIETGDRSQSNPYYEEAIAIGKNYSRTRTDFVQEMKFLQAVAEKKSGKPLETIMESTREFLAIDPELTNLHAHDIMWNKQAFSWSDFDNLCTDLAASMTKYNRELVRGFCAFKQNSSAQAKEIFEGLKASRPDDGILVGLPIATEIARGETEGEQALANLSNIVPNKRLLASVILRDCLTLGKRDCANEVDKRYGQSLHPLYQHWFAAQKFAGSGDAEFKKNVQDVLSMSNGRFRPVKELLEK